MGRLRIKVLEPEPSRAYDLAYDVVFATTGSIDIVEVERVMDPEKIKKFDVETPALVINDKVLKFSGAPPRDEIKKWVAELN